jgi:hypothetical protein
MRMLSRADVIRQPGPYIWVLPAENPLGLGPLYVRKPFLRKGKMEFLGKPVEISAVPIRGISSNSAGIKMLSTSTAEGKRKSDRPKG